jgi:ElaB/YqjD/DUF883 family membrane-anchored ribosome-binding protein
LRHRITSQGCHAAEDTHMNDLNPTVTTNSGPAPHVIGDGVDRLARGAHHGIDAASDAARPAIDRIASGAHHAVESADALARQSADALERAGVKSEQMLDVGTAYMREHPVLTIGLAVAAGYMLSRLLPVR